MASSSSVSVLFSCTTKFFLRSICLNFFALLRTFRASNLLRGVCGDFGDFGIFAGRGGCVTFSGELPGTFGKIKEEALGDFRVLGDFGVLGVFVVDFLFLGDLVPGVAFLVDFEPRPDGVLADFRGFFVLDKDSDDFRRLDVVSREVGRAFLPGEEPELEAVFVIEPTDEPEGVANDSRLA